MPITSRTEAAGRARTIRLRFSLRPRVWPANAGRLLLQLPPSLSFDGAVVSAFLDMVRAGFTRGPSSASRRHATWFSARVTSLLERYAVSRVAADPPPVPDAANPAGWGGPRRISGYTAHPACTGPADDAGTITALAAAIRRETTAEQVWCIFDNTASGAAIENACELRERLTVGRLTIPFGHRSSGLPEVTSRR